MARGKVLIIGASVRAAAQSAVRAGLSVVAADMFGDIDLREVAEFIPLRDYPGDFANVIADHPDLPVLYTGGLENHPQLLELPREVLGNRGGSLRMSRDVLHWTTTLKERGLRVADVKRWSDRPAFGENWLAKSLHSAGGGGVGLVDAAANLDSASFYQRRIEGPTLAAVFVGTDNGATLFGVTGQLSGLASLHARPFSYCGSVGPVDVAQATQDVLLEVGELFVDEIGLRGVFGIDFVLHKDGAPVPIEVNPRYTASVEVLELATGGSVFAGDESASTEPTRFAIKLIVYAAADITVGELPRDCCTSRVWLADVPHAGTTVNSGEPVCSVLALGADRADAEAAIAEQLEQLARVVPIFPEAVLVDVTAARFDNGNGFDLTHRA